MNRGVFGGLLSGFLFGLWVFAAISQRWPTWQKAWLGEIGLLPFGLSLATVVLLAWGTRMALSNFRLANRSHLADRFREAAMMVAADKLSARLTGLTLVGSLVLEDRVHYGEASLRLMVACVDEADADIGRAISGWKRDAPSVDAIHRVSDRTTAGALTELSRAFPNGVWPKTSTIVHEGRLLMGNAFLSHGGMVNESFINLSIPRIVLNMFFFNNCQLINCKLYGVVGNGLQFVKCDFRDTELWLGNMEEVVSPTSRNLIDFVDCTGTHTATINGVQLSAWLSIRDQADAAKAAS